MGCICPMGTNIGSITKCQGNVAIDVVSDVMELCFLVISTA